MKRITFILAAIICLAISAMAQPNQPNQQNADQQPLAPAVWKQGLAICAHFTAVDRRFGKKLEEIKAKYPNGYTLDNLNEVYSKSRQWDSIYKQFKKEEGRNGTIDDLKGLVTPQVWKLVEPEFTTFIKDHPEIANAVPDAQGENAEENNGEDVKQDENAGEKTTVTMKDDKKAGEGCSVGTNLPLWLSIIGALLGLWALLTALSNRGKINEMRRNFARELERTNANLQEFSTDAADQMKALSIRLTGRNKYNTETEPVIIDDEPEEEAEAPIIEETEVPIEEKTDEPIEPADEDPTVIREDEVMNLFMNKPDEDDNFTHVSDTFEPGNSIYVLTTFDGSHGTFEVIDKPEVYNFALMMPAENLIRACSGNAIQIPNGTRIVTDRPGEAEFIDGHWHVVVKAIIHYEG